MLLGPGGGVGNLVREGRGAENLCEERIRVEGDALDDLIELLRRDGGWRRSLLLIGWGSLLLVWWRRLLLLVSGLGLLLIGWGSLPDDGGLGEGDRRKSQQCQSGQRFVSLVHNLFLYLRSFLRAALYGKRGFGEEVVGWVDGEWRVMLSRALRIRPAWRELIWLAARRRITS